MNKANIPFAIGGGIAAVALVAVIALTVVAFNKAGDADSNFKRTVSSYLKTSKNVPYPSEENSKIAKAKLDATTNSVAVLKSTFSTDALSLKQYRSVTAGTFLTRRREVIDALVKDAPMGDSDQPVAREGSSFGFARYDDGNPPEKSNVPKLCLQLSLVDKFVRILYASGIVSLDGVGREEFESASSSRSSGSDDDGGGRRRGSRRSSAAADNKSAVVADLKVTQAPALDTVVPMARLRFKLSFTARESAVIKALDSFDSMWPYVMISSFEMHKVQDSDVVFADEKSAEASKNARVAEPTPEAPVLREKPKPRTARLVSGPLREVPVKVSLTLDFYSTELEIASAKLEDEE